MRAQDQPLVSVVIPTLNAGVQFAELLRTVRSQEIADDVEIVIIDSGSRDDTADIARRAGARVLTTPRSEFSHGGTRNQAIRASRGAFVALTVQDALPVDEHWLSDLIAPLLEDPTVAGSYGLQLARPSAGLLARARSWGWCEAHNTPLVKSLDAPKEFWHLSPQERVELIRFDNVTACVRRSVWEEVPFPNRDYAEDLAWAKQVLRQGYHTAFVPESKVWHSHERGWRYNLCRAYMEGYERVRLVRWPSPELSLGEALRALRRAFFFALTRRFDPMVQPAAILRFVRSEIKEYETLCDDRSVTIYVAALQFSKVLLNSALRCCGEEVLPEGAWAELIRFAVVTLVGENLGANIAGRPRETGLPERVMWGTIHKLLYGRV